MAKAWNHVLALKSWKTMLFNQENLLLSCFYWKYYENPLFFERRCAAFLVKKIWISLKNVPPLLSNVGPSHTEGVANRRFYICFIKSRERRGSHRCNPPHIWGGWAPCRLIRDWFFMKSNWFCKTFAATTLHMQKQCTRWPQGIQKSTFSINLHSSGSCTLKLETLLAWFQLCTPKLPGTQIKWKLDFS